MGRIGIRPIRWEPASYYIYKWDPSDPTVALVAGLDCFQKWGARIFGGLPLFRDGRIQFTARWGNYGNIHVGARLPLTATQTGTTVYTFTEGYGANLQWPSYTSTVYARIYRDTTVLGEQQFSVYNLRSADGYWADDCYLQLSENQIAFKFHTIGTLTATDSTYTNGFVGFVQGTSLSLYYPAIDFGGFNPLWPTESIAHLKYRVLRNGNPVWGAMVAAVHHKIREMMLVRGGYFHSIIPNIGVAQDFTGPDGWVEIPLDTDDGPWIVSVSYYDGQTQTWCTAEVKPAEMPILYV